MLAIRADDAGAAFRERPVASEGSLNHEPVT
jgi:hypothetical protein